MKQIFTALFLLLSASLYAQTQVVTGNVFDEASNAPLPGAVVVVLNTSASLGGVTDVDGHFRISGVPVGRQSLKISMLGYEPRNMQDIVVTAGKEVVLNIGLSEALNTLKNVTIVYDKSKDPTRTNNDMAMVSARSFNIEDTKRYAGALGDPSRMAANFAGVISGNDSRNDIVVRGNAPTGMLWQLEGLNIPNPNHFGALNSTGGPVSMLNNNNLAKSDFLTSAFPAQYGNALAGVFDLSMRNGNKDRNEFVGQVGFNGFELGAEGPLGKAKNTSYIINYRYSTLGVFHQLGINFGTGTAVPLYQDVNYKIDTKIGKKGKLDFFGIAGNSKVNFLGNDVDTTQTDMYGDYYRNIRTNYATTITGVSYQYQLSDKTSTKLTLGYSTTYEKYTLDSIGHADRSIVLPNGESKFNTGKISAVWNLTHKFSAKDNMQAGVTYDNTNFNLLNKDIYNGINERVYVDQSGNFDLTQAYIQWKHRFNYQWSFVSGVHAQMLSVNNSIAVEPRLSFRYAFAPKQAISIGYGLNHQAQSIYTYYVQTSTANGISYTNKDLGFTRSSHLVLTYDWNITEHMRLKAEGYYQYLDKVPVEQFASSFSALNTGASFAPSDADSLVNKGTGYNYGIELTLERYYDKGLYFLVTGSLFNSKYKGSDNIERNTAFNTGYVLNVLGGKEFAMGKGRVLGISLKASSIGGCYLTPVDFAASQVAGKVQYKDEEAYSQKQPDYFRVDCKLSYRREFKRSTLEFSLDLQNVTNHKNIFSQSYDPMTNKIVNQYQQGFFPVPMLRYTF